MSHLAHQKKNVNDVWVYDLVTFWKLPNLTDRDLPHLDLPTSEKLANQGRINPRHCKERSNLLPRNKVASFLTMTWLASC